MSPRKSKSSPWTLFRASPLLFLRRAGPLLRVGLEKKILGPLDRVDDSYRRWQRDFEPRRAAPAGQVLAARVVFVFPAGLAPEELRATAASLLGQTAGCWEACFRSPADQAAAGLDAARGRVLLSPELDSDPGGLFAAARVTQAGWIIAVSRGVRYAPWLVERLAGLDETRAVLVYWDEDVWDGQGPRREPFFKPDWSPELWLSLDILNQSACSRPALLSAARQNGAARPLPALLAWQPEPLHLPAVLSHLPRPAWENLETVEAHRADALAWLSSQGLAEARFEQVPGSAVLRPAWPVRPQKISIVIPTRDHLFDLKRCLDSILSLTRYPDYEIILVDNQSSQADVLEYYAGLRQEHPRIQLVAYNQPFNINTAWNLGASKAGGSLLLFLNNDTQVLSADWLEELARAAQVPGVGISGALLEYPDGSIQHNGIVLGMTGHANHLWIGEADPPPSPYGPPLAWRNVTAVTGACQMIRREVFEQVGGFTEAYELIFSDIEISLKARALGYRTALNPFARLLHFEGRSRARFIPSADIRKATHDFLALIERGDPYYNPNLSLARTHPACRRKFELPAAARLEAITAFSELRNRAEAAGF